MMLTATCAHCGKPLKSIHLALPVDLRPSSHAATPTLNNCAKCGARGAYIDEKKEAPHDAA